MSEIWRREPELPIAAARGLGEQVLELVAPMEEYALAERREQLVFSSPHGVDILEPFVLSELTAHFMPAQDSEPWLRSWQLSGGRVVSAHVYWRFSYDKVCTIPVVQLRSETVGGVQQAVEVGVHMKGTIDKEAEALEIRLGTVNPEGKPEFLIHVALTKDELSETSRAITDVINGVRCIVTTAETSSHVQMERQPL